MPDRVGEILVRERACAPAALRAGLENQVIFGGRLGTNLLELGAVSEEALARALGRQHAVPSLFGELRLDAAATGLIAPEVADRCDAVPYLLADRRLALLVIDPRNLATLDEMAFATGKQVHPIVVPEARVWALLRRAYGIERQLRGIDVEFGKLAGSVRPGSGVEAAPGGPAAGGLDLMDEGAFDALYAKPAAPPRAPTPAPPPASPVATAPPPAPRAPPPAPEDDDVIELTDLLEPEAAPPPPAQPAPALPAEVAAALGAAPGRAPPTRLVVPPPRDEPEPSPLSFQDALRFLEGVDERDAIAKTVLRYARSKFSRAVLLTVQRGAAHGWAGLGAGLGAAAVRRMHLALGTPGMVDTVVRTQAHFLGPIPKTEANIRLLKKLGGGVPGNALLVPILARGRVVNVFYADAGKGKLLDSGAVGELLILATRIAKSYDALLARVR